MQSVSVVVPCRAVDQAAAVADGGVAADGAVGQRRCAQVGVDRPPPLAAELPLIVQSVSVAVLPSPRLYSRRRHRPTELPLIVQSVR